MIKKDIKQPSLEVRIKLADITNVKMINGEMTMVNTARATWEYASVGLFGKMIADLDKKQSDELNGYSDADITAFGGKVKTTIGNPTKG